MVIKKQIEQIMKVSKHSLETEGFTITEEHTKLVEKRLRNKINDEDFLKEVRKRIKQKEK
ncbi:hypothetical protein [Bacillus mobilis]